ncbi:hypothetical protein [Leptolyngbya sp. FACHB-261]|uniref:hypothetical protein n=1 Tax=Leptolyngbya sp. FACHB-261 TaxID=2692806 RepID=UPI00168A09C3|nr:hypothetical protein [Leptolyngbya sp. FACHB-261]MBD2104909.1 hypothetical protein [Leptolyngbya sp. FACHB-261]
MERGLLWLPLLALFIWLTWAGWNEYQKVEAYRRWAAGFRRAKYDIYAVLGQDGEDLIWGKPTRRGPVELQRVRLQQVQAIYLNVDGQRIDPSELLTDKPASKPVTGKRVVLELVADPPAEIPFTEVSLAAAWCQTLNRQLEATVS